MEDEILNPIDPRPYIVYKGQTIFKDEYKPLDERYPNTFEEYAKAVKQTIQYADTEPAAELGVIKAEGKTKAAINVNAEARQASEAITPESVKDQIAERFFNIEGAGPKYVYDYRGGRRVEPNLEEYLGDRYPLYKWYKATGKLELSLVPQEIINDVVNEVKSGARQIVYRDANAEDLETARVVKATDGANIKAQQKQDFLDYERLYGAPLVRIETVNGRTFVPPTVSVLDDPRYKAAVADKDLKLYGYTKDLIAAQEAQNTKVEEFETKRKELEQRISLGKVVVPGELYSLQIEAMDLRRAQQDLNFDIDNLNKTLAEKQIDDQELLDLAKNYSNMDKLAITLEQSFVGTSAMVGAKLMEYAQAGLEGTADFFNLEGAQLKIQEAQRAAAAQTRAAVNYNERLKNQLQYEFPKPLEFNDNSTLGDYIGDILINNSPSILMALGTVSGVPAAASLSTGAFFIMEAGGNIADLEIAQKNAPKMLSILNKQLDTATSNVEKSQILKEIEYYENALEYTELQKGFSGLMYGGTAALAERFGGAAIFKNFNKMARSYGNTRLKRIVNDGTARIISKGIGIAKGTAGGVVIEEAEEVLTLAAQNLTDIVVFGENKSIIDGLDPEFVINVAVTSLAIQGGGVASNVQRVILSEITTRQEQKEFDQLRDKVASLTARLKDQTISKAERLKLKEERRAAIKEASAKVSISTQKLSRMSKEDVVELFDTNKELRAIRQEALELGEAREVGEYGEARLKELKARYDEVFEIRNSLLSKAQAAQEQEVKDNLEALETQLTEEQRKELAIKTDKKLKSQEVSFTPEINFNLGLFTAAQNIVKNVDGINYISLTPIDALAFGKEAFGANAFIRDQKNIYVNNANVIKTIVYGSKLDSRIAAVSPIHELGHARVAESKVLKDQKLQESSQRLVEQFKQYTQEQLNIGRITQDDADYINNRISQYKSKETGEVDVDEIFQLINDLVNVGTFKNSDLGNIASIKQFLNGTLQKLFGDNYHLFSIDNISEARAFVASYSNKYGKVQLPGDDEEIKASISELDGKINSVRKNEKLETKTNVIYAENLENWKSNNERRKALAAEKILNQGSAYMDLMESYAKRYGYTGIPTFEMDFYLALAKNRLIQHILNFNTTEGKFEAKNNNLHAWINSQALNKAKQAVKDMNLDPDMAKSLSDEGVQKQVEREVAEQETQIEEPKRQTSLEKAVAASATNFIREINKAVPGFLSGEVLQRIYQSIDNFIKDPANEKALNFERVPGTNKIIVQPEAAAEFQKLLSEYLIKELSDYFRNDILKRNKSAFADIVKETFKIYKLIPQSFLNKRISNWTQPLIDPRTGKQARTTVEMGGKYGGAKGNPLFERIEITQEDWINYFNSPTAKPSTKTALKKRFAEMLASGVGTDLFLRYLGEVDANGDLVNLQQFIDQQGLPVFDGANAYGITFTEMLGRDVSAVNLKYSLNLTTVQASLLESAMPMVIQNMKKLKVKTENNVVELLKSILPEDYDLKAIKEIAKVITPEFKKRDKILTKKIKEGKLFKKDKDIAMSEQVLFIALSQPTKEYFGIANEVNTDTLYIPKRKKGEERKITILNQDNINIAKQGVAELFESDNFTESEKFEFFIPGFRTGNQGTIFENNQDIVDTIGIATLNDLGIIIVDNSLKYKSKRRGVGINGKNIAKQINLKGADITQQLMAIQAKRARVLTIKIAKYFRDKAVKAKTEEERSTIKLQAFFITNSLNSYADSFVRKTATLDYVEDGVTQENGYFEHLLQSNILQKTIGGFITGRINEKELNKVLESMRGALLQETTAKDIDTFIKSNQPMGSTVGQDPIVRLKSPMLNAIGKNIVLRNPGNANDIISIGNSTTIESSQKLGEGIRNYTYYALPRKVQNYSLNTTRNLTIVPVYDYNTFTGEQGELLKYRSEMFRIMSGPFEYYYELNRLEGGRVMDPDIITEDAVTDDLLALSFFRYDTDLEQDSTDLTGDFTEEEKNPIKVFSIIGNSVMDFMEKQGKFKGLMFSADAEAMSRVKLYDRFANMMAKKFGYEVLIQDIKGPASGELFYRRYYVVDPAYIENGKLIKPKQQIQYSLNDMSKDFNLIIEDKFGIEEYKRFSEVVGKRRGAKKDRLNFKNFFFPPSAEDFMGLMYDLIGKSEKGDAQKQWFMDNIVMPYTIGVAQLDSARQSIRRAHRNLLTENAGLKKVLRQKIVDGDFTHDQAIRVYLWNLKGVEIPGLSQRDQKKLTELVAQSEQLKDFAGQLLALANMEQGWPDPSEYWDAETLLSDLNNLTQKANRKTYLKEFIENANTIFSPENKNKLRAALGNNWVEALEDIIYRMENGTNRPAGTNRIVNAWNNWVNRSIGAIMFFNRRSALLQTLSTVNFINWSDNNPINAAIAFANQKQYWKDFVMIFNSDKLKERRGGLRMDVSEAEIANAAAASKNDPGAILSYLLKIGFSLTQIADSFAISSGGATFYRNRVKTYLDQGLEKEEAETKAFQDFSRISDETQQSSDPMLISQEQASVLGRLILAFQNTSAQYTRRGRKGIRDLITGRGDFKTNLSVSIYYLAVQNIIFNALQNALFTFIPGFDDEPEDETLTEKELERKQQKEAATYSRAINGSLDTILRGMGLRGAVIATLKNTIMKYYEQQQKDPFFKDNAQVVLEALNISPPIGSKARKFYNALRTMDFEKDVIEERGLDLFIEGRFKPSPMYSVIGNISAAFANIPLDRAYDEVVSISEAFDQRNTEWQRLALGLGYKSWAVGAKQEEEDLIKQTAKALRKAQGIEKAKKTRAENKAKKEAAERKMIEKMSIDEYIKYLNEQKKKKKK